MFTLIFVSLLLAGWLALGFLPWLAWSVATRGHAGLAMLPLCMFAAVVGGLAVPILIRDDEWGLLLSAAAAGASSSLLLWIRRLAPEWARAQTVRTQDRERAEK